MFKQRFASLACTLALLGSATFGLVRSVSAAPGEVVVTGTVTSVSSISLSSDSIVFGSMNFVGDIDPGASNIRGACHNPQGVTGARYVSNDIVVHVVSSTAYDVTLDALPSSYTSLSAWQDNLRISTVGWDDDCDDAEDSYTLRTIYGAIPPGPWHWVDNAGVTAGSDHRQYMAVDVMLGGPVPVRSLSATFVYALTPAV